jgi:6-phosphogluconate dehydrogenase (decarboxylating)
LNIDRALRAGADALLELTALVMSVRFEGPRRAAAFDTALEELVPKLTAGDVVVDGSHSYYRDDIDWAQRLAKHGPHYVDRATSGGVWGLANARSSSSTALSNEGPP